MVHRKGMHMEETMGERMRRLRKDKGLKQEQVAAILGLNRKAVSHYENDIREPSFETLVKMAELYQVSTDYLLGKSLGRQINATNLTAKEYALIRELVAGMSEKNNKLKGG